MSLESKIDFNKDHDEIVNSTLNMSSGAYLTCNRYYCNIFDTSLMSKIKIEVKVKPINNIAIKTTGKVKMFKSFNHNTGTPEICVFREWQLKNAEDTLKATYIKE